VTKEPDEIAEKQTNSVSVSQIVGTRDKTQYGIHGIPTSKKIGQRWRPTAKRSAL